MVRAGQSSAAPRNMAFASAYGRVDSEWLLRVQRERETTSIETEADREEAEEVDDLCTEEDVVNHRDRAEAVIIITT